MPTREKLQRTNHTTHILQSELQVSDPVNIHEKLKALTLPKAPEAACAEVSYQGRVHPSTEMPESRMPEVFNNEHTVGCSTTF